MTAAGESTFGIASSPALVVGVFGTFLTSISIVAALSVERGARWPTPWEVLGRAGLPGWFLLGLTSVVLALVGAATGNDFVGAFALVLALVGLALGARSLWGLFALSSAKGRRDLVVDLLSSSIRDAGPAAGEPDLGEVDTEDHVAAWFSAYGAAEPAGSDGTSIELVPSTLRLYAERGDPEALARLVDEVHAAAVRTLADGQGETSDRVARADLLLGVLREIFGELATRVAAGQLGEATAAGALARAGEAVIDVAGRAPEERLAARHLAAFCRRAGEAVVDAEAVLVDGTGDRAGQAALHALRATCATLQQAARWAVDPDPPGIRLPHGHPWRAGLSDPEAALVWIWSAAESPSGPYGVGLYALCEILTGHKFFGSYWDGYDVWTEIERRFAATEPRSAAAKGAVALARIGGLAPVSLELAAARLVALGRRSPGGRGGAIGQDAERLLACELFLAGGGFKPAERDPIADLAWLLTDRSGNGIWALVRRQLAGLHDGELLPPLLPLHRNPGACALAVCLRLVPPGPSDDASPSRALREFALSLPGPLAAEAAALGRTLARFGGKELPAGRSDASNLIAVAERVRGLAPAGSSAARMSSEPRAAHAPAAPTPAGPDGFVSVPALIATARSPIAVDLIQCDPRWLEEWEELRAELDAALLAAALRGRAVVRRIVRFDLAGDVPQWQTRAHYRWTDALATAANCFQRDDADTGLHASRYRVRQLVLPFDGSGEAHPSDRVLVSGDDFPAPDPERMRCFEATWSLRDSDTRHGGPGLVELATRGASPIAP